MLETCCCAQRCCAHCPTMELMKPILYASALTLVLTYPLFAAAQTASPVQVYGLLDAGVVAERGCGGACARTRIDSGIASGSRLGVRGREDFGGGTAAVYTLEAGILNDTGASTRTASCSAARPMSDWTARWAW